MSQTILCPYQAKAVYVCLSKTCQSTTFICCSLQDPKCSCISQHTWQCNIRKLQDIKNDIHKFLSLTIFSPNLKGQGIQLGARNALQTYPPPRNSRFALTFSQIYPNSVTYAAFKVKNLKGCVGIGIMNRKALQSIEYKYMTDHDYMGHGAYMILSNGFKYSNKIKQENFKQVPKYTIQQGDNLFMKYSQNTLTFSKWKNPDNEYEGKYYEYLTIPKQEQDLYFGVYLYEIGDNIQAVRL